MEMAMWWALEPVPGLLPSSPSPLVPLLQMSENVEGVTVVCPQPLHVQSEDKRFKYQWKFRVHSKVSPPLCDGRLRACPPLQEALGSRTGIWGCLRGDTCQVFGSGCAAAVSPASSHAAGLVCSWLLSAPPAYHHK